MWSTIAVWKQYNKMAVLHFFLVNSTLIYILFSLIISEFLVDIKHNQNRWYWFKVKALALIYFCNCMKKIVENLKTGLRFLSCNFFLAIFKWNYLSQEWICKVCKTKFLIRRVLEPILDLFPISNTKKFERNFLRLPVSFFWWYLRKIVFFYMT